jgi:hypothetical protein
LLLGRKIAGRSLKIELKLQKGSKFAKRFVKLDFLSKNIHFSYRNIRLNYCLITGHTDGKMYKTVRRTETRMNKHMDGQTDGWTDKQSNRHIDDGVEE